jgi:thiamine pyrophosphate-dependent acetolactate synthase large subunit-like protein
MLENQGFTVEENAKTLEIKKNNELVWKVTANENEISVVQVINNEDKELMKRIFGNKAYGYLKQKEEEFRRFLQTFEEKKWDSTHESVLTSLGIVGKKKTEKEELEEASEESEEPHEK